MCNAINAELLPGRAVRSAARFSLSALISWPATTQPQGSPSGAASPDSRHGWSVPPQSRTAPAMAAVAAWRRREKAHEQASDRRFYLFPHQDQEEGRFRADQTGVESGGGVYPLGSKSDDVTHGGYREIGFNCPASRNLIARDRRVVIADPLSIFESASFYGAERASGGTRARNRHPSCE
jgi:hypothetical protein